MVLLIWSILGGLLISLSGKVTGSTGVYLLELAEEIEFKLKIYIILSSSHHGFYNKYQHQLLLNSRKFLPTIYTPSSMRVFKY